MIALLTDVRADPLSRNYEKKYAGVGRSVENNLRDVVVTLL